MSTLEVSNLNDGTTTVATTFVTNGSLKSFVFGNSAASPLKSLNVSSGVDNGTGNYTYNFTSAMDSDDFTNGTSANTGSDRSVTSTTKTTTSYILESFNTSGSNVDSSHSSNVAGDLA
jgi:hypothetical protein